MSHSSVVISSRVIRTIQRLPDAEKAAITAALANDIFLGKDPKATLSPYQSLIYTFICDYVKRDTLRQNPGVAL